MAARTPSDFSDAINFSGLVPRQPVLTTDPSLLADNQQFMLEKDEMILSDCFSPTLISGAGWQVVRRYHTIGVDYCDAAGMATVNCQFALLSVGGDAASTHDVALYHVGKAARVSIAVVAAVNAWTWRGWSGAFAIDSDGTENIIEIQAQAAVGKTAVIGAVMLCTGT